MHPVGCLMGKPYGDINETSSGQPFLIFGL
jgi:hypothetical protein